MKKLPFCFCLLPVTNLTGACFVKVGLYYLQLAWVLNPCGASAKLASNEVFNIPNAWQDINELKRFFVLFPQITLIRSFSRSNDNSL